MFFPVGFWKIAVLIAIAAFSIVGLDLVLGAHFISWLSRTMNKKISVDQQVIDMLAKLKRDSDQEFDMEPTLLRGLGRFVASGILFLCVYLMFAFLLPKLT